MVVSYKEINNLLDILALLPQEKSPEFKRTIFSSVRRLTEMTDCFLGRLSHFIFRQLSLTDFSENKIILKKQLSPIKLAGGFAKLKSFLIFEFQFYGERIYLFLPDELVGEFVKNIHFPEQIQFIQNINVDDEQKKTAVQPLLASSSLIAFSHFIASILGEDELFNSEIIYLISAIYYNDVTRNEIQEKFKRSLREGRAYLDCFECIINKQNFKCFLFISVSLGQRFLQNSRRIANKTILNNYLGKYMNEDKQVKDEIIELLLKNSETVDTVSAIDASDEQILLSERQTKRLSELKVSLDVQIGGLNMNAQDLLDLSSGNAFEFELNPQSRLPLFIEGERIAEGKFVSIDNKLGIEILEVQK